MKTSIEFCTQNISIVIEYVLELSGEILKSISWENERQRDKDALLKKLYEERIKEENVSEVDRTSSDFYFEITNQGDLFFLSVLKKKKLGVPVIEKELLLAQKIEQDYAKIGITSS